MAVRTPGRAPESLCASRSGSGAPGVPSSAGVLMDRGAGAGAEADRGAPRLQTERACARSPLRPLTRRAALAPGPAAAALAAAPRRSAAKIEQFVAACNSNAEPFVWVTTADSILAEIERLCGRNLRDGTLERLGPGP